MQKEISHADRLDKLKMDISYVPMVTVDGECVELHSQTLETISQRIIYSLEEKEEIENKKEKVKEILEKKANQTEFHTHILEKYGHFYFNFYKRFDNIERQYLFRFLYLCSYMNYDNYLSNGVKLIKEGDLQELLNLKETEYNKTISILKKSCLITINNNHTVSVNNKYCKKGKIIKNGKIEVIRMFDNAIKELYKNAAPREHKKLALLIELLPYINLKYNIVCKNPNEEFRENITPYKMTELCALLGYDKTHSARLKKDLFKLRVNNEKVIGIFEDDDGKAIFINPRVMYKGTEINISLEDLFCINK
ncbi:MAG: hypothetical protein ACRC7N_03820 [Clostridium sp.]